MGSIFPTNIMGSGVGPFGGWVRKILNTESDSLIGFWLQDEVSGTTAEDSSGEGNDGTYSNVTLADATFLGRPVPLYDQTNNPNLDFASAGFDADFDGDEGTIIIPCRVASGAWTDGANRYLIYIAADGDNQVGVYKSSTNNRLSFFRFGNATAKTENLDGLTSEDWLIVAITWSVANDQQIYYLNGSPSGAADTGLDNWVGDPSEAVIGNRAASFPFDGWIGPVPVWSTPLSASQIDYLNPT